jgi:phosphate transport system substrate-binding protein
MKNTLMKPLLKWNGLGGRRIFTSGLGLLLLTMLMTGCPAGKQESENAPAPKPTPGKVVIRGSNTIGEELAPRLIAEFKKEHPEMKFDLEFKGTAYGLGNLLGGICDIAAASRAALKEQEDLARDRGVQLKECVLGAYAVAVIVNAANPITGLNSNQVQALFTGQAANWSDVGGGNAAVQLYIRDPISGTHIGFKELAMNNEAYGPGAKMFTNYQAIAAAVAADPNGIGYCGLDLVTHAGVKSAAIGGVTPSAASVSQKTYPYARVLRFYSDTVRESPDAKSFLEFVVSPKGQQVVTGMGYAGRP